MSQIPRPQLAVYVMAALAIVLVGGRFLRADPGPVARERPRPAALRVDSGASSAATVHVAGAVQRPGVYRLRARDRVDDAVRRAGGPTSNADLDALNLSAKVEDGRQILVPRREATQGGPGAGSASAGGAGPALAINLNTATLEQLDGLDGVGPTMAQKILDYRREHGGFKSVAELDAIPGIGAKRMDALRERVRV